MRGNWEAGEALGLAPGHQLQQQQQSIMEEQRLPLHSPTTPAWGGITDRIVEEPTEDKNNDSGVSPDHYTSNSVSPRSRRSSSTVNCSLSPGSATSQDSNAMQCGNFDYSQQSIYKNCESPIDYGRLRPMDDGSRDQTNEHQPMDMVSISMKQESDDSEVPQDSLPCPVCPFVTLNRLQFTEHLAGHYSANCEMPDLSKSSLAGHDETNDHQQEQLQQMQQHMNAMEDVNRASPSQGERSEQESEEADEPGLRVPRVNSQGKVKTFRCKQCNFVAITKLEFWEHSRGHIKAEKLLTCPKCPFVTEYKHHLEYHLRNHFGSKPFKCEKCSYSCVNKSMLNSHLKSHSNVYQYRCANCSYATKYCHSLKLHLRKYSHKPAMVLNADGSPNPLPIIDVYGTRRGPKQKPSGGSTGKPSDDNLAQIANGTLSIQPTQFVGDPQISPISRHSLNPINPMNVMHMMGNGVGHGGIPLHYGQMFTGFPLANHYPMTDDATEKHLENFKTNLLAEYVKVITNDRINAEYHQDTSMNDLVSSNINSNSLKISEMAVSCVANDETNNTKVATVAAIKLETNADVSTEVFNKVTPLDLSKPDVLANNNNHSNTNNNIKNDITAKFNEANMNSPRTSGKSRRKGRAVKLERRIIEDESEDERDRDTDDRDATTMENKNNSTNILPTYEEETVQKASVGGVNIDTCKEKETRKRQTDGATVAIFKEKTPDRNVGGVGMSNEFTCQYCEIAFGNDVMYTVHMGYHGYKDPYTCNMCGHVCDDKVSFFLHIAKSKHS